MQEILTKTEDKMKKAFDSLSRNFFKLRTGRASVSILDDIKINYYGEPTPIKQLCSINAPEPRLIVIQPYDKTTLADISKAVLAANLGITPENDGTVIRLPFQALTEDKRKEVVKQLKRIAEEAKVVIRNIRREANDEVKKLEKDGELSEDESRKLQKDDIQKLTDKWIDAINDATANKEKELMAV